MATHRDTEDGASGDTDVMTSHRSPEVTICVRNLAFGLDEKIQKKQKNANENPSFTTVDEEDAHSTACASLRRDRPFSASVASRRSVGSSASRSSLSSTIVTTDYASKCMFAYRSGAVDRGREDCCRFLVERSVDGEPQDAWLLIEIDHWDREIEKLIILTDYSLFVVKYDFIKQTIVNSKRIPLVDIGCLQTGTLVYPAKSLMSPRNYGGVRVHFEHKTQSGFGRSWNRWSRASPYTTLTHHLLAYATNETDTTTYNVDEFAQSLTQAVRTEHRRLATTDKFRVSESSIVVEAYASLGSIIHNQSRLGFNLERGGISF